jgi:hypothetical protein
VLHGPARPGAAEASLRGLPGPWSTRVIRSQTS